jgi:hypothetical protein
LGFGFGLAVPDTILPPDSLGPIRPPSDLTFGSSTDSIYVASDSADIIVAEGRFTGSFQRIQRINTDTPVEADLPLTGMAAPNARPLRWPSRFIFTISHGAEEKRNGQHS